MIDCQMNTPHLASLGGVEITQGDYLVRLKRALTGPPADFGAPAGPSPQLLVQRISQTS